MNNSTTNTPILDDDAVAEIEARAQKATPGPWVYFGEPDDNVFWGEIRSAAEDGSFAHITDTPELDERDNDMEFIAHARQDIPALCATVRALRELNKGLAEDNVNLTNEAHKAHDRWQSELHQTELRLKAVTNDRNQILIERDDALRRLRIYENDKTPANTEYEL